MSRRNISGVAIYRALLLISVSWLAIAMALGCAARFH